MNLLEKIVTKLHKRYSKSSSISESGKLENIQPEALISRCLPDKDESGYEVIIIYALVNNKSVGYLRSLNSFNESTDSRTAFLKGPNKFLGFDISPDYRGKGIGTFLMHTMMELLSDEGFDEVYINNPSSTSILVYDSILNKLKVERTIIDYDKITLDEKKKCKVCYRISLK